MVKENETGAGHPSANLQITSKVKCVSYFNSPIQNITPLRDVTLREVADIISNDLKLKSATEEMRALADSDKRNIFKCTKFPYVTPSGIFSTRKAT